MNKKYVIIGLNKIKHLKGRVLPEGKGFYYTESYKTRTSRGHMEVTYKMSDVFDNFFDAISELEKRRDNKIQTLKKEIQNLSTTDTIKFFDEQKSLYYTNSCHKDEPGFNYKVM